ncbi:hypothetical protein CKO15_08530 [Halorhodospira abdelmalekii]|uniref:hypothetical protein n=1 Tax=Halorhodospira abdelmalekii TaxID=421629 RepID=UPI00190403EF|nr:hypothetical protein [Halorhodospira abdelmalekii]MBK1735327.1 hypothetical protein [Halorhodospira abdelmalekii]
MKRFFSGLLPSQGKRIVEDLQQGRISIPIPESALANALSEAPDPGVRDLTLTLGDQAEIIISGYKRLGTWIRFVATFKATPPPLYVPGPAIDLALKRARPLGAGPFILKAMRRMEQVEVVRSKARVRIDYWVEKQRWASMLPTGMLEYIRVADISSDPDRGVLLVSLSLAMPEGEPKG